ncbi:hypothetical protein [Acrocarpospora pleiomorpha]|uniref:hypothetical protein n=1 Tax=Acrocarpospora pleiomorpha TaxID=90975 RepID=UPI0012D2DAA9|nr:hypothetical protein [Acrocarpospora pleiomorpha]
MPRSRARAALVGWSRRPSPSAAGEHDAEFGECGDDGQERTQQIGQGVGEAGGGVEDEGEGAADGSVKR